MEKNKWQLHRAGVLNFWYYDEEEFNFANGKLLLRGSNGSGKSVTMQSLIPVLLDGKKSPDRLDPFGSKARRMEDYLLGEKGVVDRDERTGYLFLEYKRQGTEQYLTTGIGLRAKRHSNLDFWGFVILDNRRVGRDFLLYKKEYSLEEGQEQKIPLSRRELENRLETGGKVVRTQGEYMKLVNKYVFGFESVDAYEELIKLLIQLRSPKLSKEFKPTVIYEILNESLPAISDEELRPLSDTVESMDQIKQQLEQLNRDQQSLTRLCKHYDEYNQLVLAEKAEGLLQANKKQNSLLQKQEELKILLQENQQQQVSLGKQIVSLTSEQAVLKEEEKQLKKHDVFQAEQEIQELQGKITGITNRISEKTKNLEKKQRQERQLIQDLNSEEEKRIQAEKNISDLIDDLDFDADEAKFTNHGLAVSEFKRNYQSNYVFDLWEQEADSYQQQLEQILKVLREFSKVKERFQEADKELADAHKELDLKRNEERKWEDFFEEEKGRVLEIFHHWRKENHKLKITDEETQIVAKRIMQIYEPYRYEEVRELVFQAFSRHAQEMQREIVSLQKLKELKEGQLEETRIELQEWKAKKDPEPERHQDTVGARQRLVDANIPHVAFFSAVEFFEQVSLEQRERLESAITQMGLLDALIVPEKYLDRVLNSDRVIKPNPQFMAHTLADFLYPTPIEGNEVSGEDIDKVLRSILVGSGEVSTTSIGEDGLYQIGILSGHAPKEKQSVYIGIESRRQFRLQQISRLEGELEILEQEKAGIEEGLVILQTNGKMLEEEYRAFPQDRDLYEAFETLKGIRLEKAGCEKEVEKRNLKLKEIQEKLQKIRDSLRSLTEILTLELTEDAFEKAKDNMESYRSQLRKLQLTYKDFSNCCRQIKQFTQSRLELVEDVDELKGEINSLESDLKRLNMTCERVKERLQALGVDEIRRRISQVITRLEQVPEEILTLTRENEGLKHTRETIKKDLIGNEQELQVLEKLCQLWQQVFMEDDQLQLLEKVDSSLWADEKAVLNRAKDIRKRYSNILSNPTLDREKLTDRLNKAFYQEQGILVEYRLTQEKVLEVTDLPTVEKEKFQIQIEQLRQKSRRIQLIMEYNGKRVTPYYVREEMEKDLEVQRSLLNVKDRELYEEIIMNSVGRIIRARINRAEQWVEKINKLMGERDTSSGLTFSLSWKPRTAEYEEEMDTKELVELLRSDARLLKEEDIQQVTQHFRSKISRAKELVADKGYGETLHQIIKEMLDYRKWFTFNLYYRREGEKRKELTNNVFFTFSGGEKAMAMYIPLFSAAYSRYMEARADAPFIISLDEAFAGVDENNIRDMFDLVEKLGFNYIINSQALWGDHDTVSTLAICELVRPKNAPFVTVVRYHWDGKVRHLLAHDKQAKEYYEEESA